MPVKWQPCSSVSANCAMPSGKDYGRPQEQPPTNWEELQASLEELQIAEEELQQQQEELAASRYLVEAERQRYQELFNFAPDGYLVTDAHGVIQEANRAAAVLLQRRLRARSKN
jgi:PAS domain-containing protein